MFNIKIKIVIGLLVAIVCIAKGETKLIITEFPLSLETNESAVIVSDFFTIPYVSKDGITNVTSIAGSGSADKPYIVTGPITLHFGQGLLTYRILTNSPFKTLFLRCGDSGSIIVESNKTIRFFENSQGGEFIQLLVTKNADSLPFFPATQYGTEYDGPLVFDFTPFSNGACRCLQSTNCSDIGEACPAFTNYCPYTDLHDSGAIFCNFTTNACGTKFIYTKGFLFNYYIIDEFLSIPYNGYVENSPGSLILTVEKSTTLTNWFPAFITSTGDDQHTFYRLKMSRKDAGLTGGDSFLFNGGGSMSYYENWEYPLPPLPPGLEYIE